jgi:hypothetical protein
VAAAEQLQNSEVLVADLKNRELAEMIMSSSTTRSSKYGCRRQVRRGARRAFATSSHRLPQILSACWNALPTESAPTPRRTLGCLCSNVAESVGRSAGAFQMAQMTGERHCLNDMPTGAANPGVFRGAKRTCTTYRPTRAVDTFARRWRWLRASVCDPYRPELHYMRGPGPKWREKHARGAGW